MRRCEAGAPQRRSAPPIQLSALLFGDLTKVFVLAGRGSQGFAWFNGLLLRSFIASAQATRLRSTSAMGPLADPGSRMRGVRFTPIERTCSASALAIHRKHQRVF